MSYKLSRRSALKGLGVALPLPFMNVMAASGKNSESAPKRYVGLFKPNGIHPPTWSINNGKEFDFQLSALMKPLEPFKKDLLILDNMGVRHQSGHHGANFLCGSGSARGASMDQVLAAHIGKDTPLKSLELTTEGIFTNQPDCSFISYDEKSRFIPRESDPQVVFDKLFRSPLSNPKARKEMSSILDSVKDNADFLARRIGKEDKQTLDEFYTMVRETEKKLAVRGKAQGPARDVNSFERPPAGGNLDQQSKSMLDIIALALWTDSTRVISYMLGNDNSRLVFDFIGVKEQHHWLSHFFRNYSIDNVTKLNKINLWHMQKYAYLLNKLKTFKEGSGTLLDNTVVHFGSGMGHSDIHAGAQIPNIMAGGTGIIKTGRYVKHSKPQSVHAMLHSLLHQFRVNCNSFQGKKEAMAGLADSNYDHYVEKKIVTFLKPEKQVIKLQGKLRLTSDITKPRLHLMDIEGIGTVKIEVSFETFNKISLPFYCGKNVYIEGEGAKKGNEWHISDISKIQEIDK